VRLLLPPSEGKTAPSGGAPVDLAGLSFPELTRRRERLLAELEKVSRGRELRALDLLGLSPGQSGELERNATLREAPAAPASEVYTGVLYERARLSDLPDERARARAERCVLIFSALWGVLAPGDRIPAYRFSSGARLPKAGSPAAFWRPALAKALADDGLIVDVRSGSYAAAWKPQAATVLAVRSFVEAPDGSRKPISHMAKAARGDVTRALLLAPAEPETPADVAAIAEAAGLRVELQATTLDVIVPAT